MISIFYGTRPEYIKVYKLYEEIKNNGISCELVKVEQHTSLIDDCKFDRIVSLDQEKNRLNGVIKNCLSDFVFSPKTRLVIVQGDTATAFGIALNAFNSNIPVAHVEAGLRTWDNDNPYPEESYRRCISSIAKYHFCVTEFNKQSLLQEKVQGNIYVVGNTVLDNLSKEGNGYGNIIPITLHRRENKKVINDILIYLDSLSLSYPHLSFVYIKHPAIELDHLPINLKILSPLPHDKLILLLKESRFVITDSGGIQEEASFFGKKTIVFRKETERQEGLGTFSFLAPTKELIKEYIKKFDHDYELFLPCPYGNGNTVKKIVSHIKEFYV
jgi:UDP-N-acetylglucosamine 2-epimerase (non-hydrolysing)